jgi:hypothetical protein
VLLTPPIIPGMAILDWDKGRELADMAADYVAAQVTELGPLRPFLPDR